MPELRPPIGSRSTQHGVKTRNTGLYCSGSACVLDPAYPVRNASGNGKKLQEEARIGGSQHFRKQERHSQKTADQQEGKNKDHEEVSEDVEPVTMDHMEHLFVLMLTSEMVAAGDVRHKEMIIKIEGGACLSAEKKRS